MPLSACSSGCVIRNEHLPVCLCSDTSHQHWVHADGEPGCPTCDGCLPRPPADGSAVCVSCDTTARRVLNHVADTWVDLAEKPAAGSIVSGGGAAGDPEACPDCDTGQPCDRSHRDTPTVLDEDRIWARWSIRAHLVAWCEILRDTRHITLPNEADIAATTRFLAAHESAMAAQERLAADLCGLPRANGTPPDRAGVAVHKAAEYSRHRAAARARGDRETGRDIIHALAEHITRHLDPLLADPDTARPLLDDLRECEQLGRRYANHTRNTTTRITCPACTERVTPDRSVPGLLRCPACGTLGDATAWEAPAADLMAEPDVVEYVRVQHRIRITGQQLRQWATRGSVTRHHQPDGAVRYNPIEVALRALGAGAKRAPKAS